MAAIIVIPVTLILFTIAGYIGDNFYIMGV